jgi:hypothetical protein
MRYPSGRPEKSVSGRVTDGAAVRATADGVLR